MFSEKGISIAIANQVGIISIRGCDCFAPLPPAPPFFVGRLLLLLPVLLLLFVFARWVEDPEENFRLDPDPDPDPAAAPAPAAGFFFQVFL
jgi:hypothetical protein